MSISGVAHSVTTTIVQANPQTFTSQLQQGFKQLTGALQSGNLESAQKAFANVQNVLESSQSTLTSSKPPVNVQSIQNDVGDLRQALGSGDLRSALTAYIRLKNDLRTSGQSDASGSAAPAPADSITGGKTGIYA